MTGPAPIVTVAVPTCNGEAHLAETLHSILSQRDADFELLICDDRSEDQTLEISRTVAGDRVRIEVNPERLGLAGNWNRCVALSQTPWVSIFHQDDLMKPGHLNTHVQAIEAGTGRKVGLIAGEADVVDERGNIVSPRVVDYGLRMLATSGSPLWFDPGGFVGLLSKGNGLRCSAVTTNKAAHSEVSGFDPSYRYVVDWDFWLRVARRWGVAWVLGPPTVSVRWHSGSETHRFKTGLDDLDETERLLHRLIELDPEIARGDPGSRRNTRRRLARAYLNRAHDALQAGRIDLAREALRRALELSPRVLGPMLVDPRLGIQMAALAMSPERACRWFSRIDQHP